MILRAVDFYVSKSCTISVQVAIVVRTNIDYFLNAIFRFFILNFHLNSNRNKVAKIIRLGTEKGSQGATSSSPGIQANFSVLGAP